jgi:hypothetical protein
MPDQKKPERHNVAGGGNDVTIVENIDRASPNGFSVFVQQFMQRLRIAP